MIGVFARADHPKGYGICRGHISEYGHHQEAEAHGYVVVIVECKDMRELKDVMHVLQKREYADQKPLPGWDPWARGDAWYAGPYEFLWATDSPLGPTIDRYGNLIDLGVKPSYGDNRALAFLSAEEILGV